MPTRVYKLYASNSSAATANAAAQLTIQRGGYITNIRMSATLSSPTNADSGNWECSMASVGQQTVNDPIGPLLNLQLLVISAANGTLQGARDTGIDGVAIPVAVGDRLYANYVGAAVASTCTIWAYVTEK